MTSLKLEDAFWAYLDDLAVREGLAWAEYAREMLEEIGPAENRAASIKEKLLQQALGAKSTRPQSRIVVAGRQQWQIGRGESAQRVWTARGLIRAGRLGSCELQLDDPECSKVHAALFPIRSQWWVADLDSKNGVWHQGKLILSARVEPNEPISMGGTEIQLLP